MHKKSLNIVKGLGFGKAVVADLEQLSVSNTKRGILRKFKQLRIPAAATKQIKKIEDLNSINVAGGNPEELLDSLIKKCKRSFDAFARKNTVAHIVFSNADWVLYSEEFDDNVKKLHQVCKPYFDAWSTKELQATIIFNGTDKWKVILDQ